jgi:anti-sigma regulatory factor (Ser/Thr protein kinase)
VAEEIPDPSSVHLELESHAESVALVRAMLAGVAELLEFEGELLDELNTTVSEACNNVVKHAYEDGVGPLIVHLTAGGDGVEVTVRDHGIGLQGTGEATDAGAFTSGYEEPGGVGIPLISALADRAEFLTPPEGGTEVRIAFSRGRSEPTDEWRGETDADARPLLNHPGDVVGTLTPVNLLGGVLGRMARLLAARARFSLERFSDLYLLFDQLAFHAARRARTPAMTFSLSAETRRLELELGPIAAMRDGLTPSEWEDPPANLRVLADELTVEPVDDGLLLRVVVGGADASAES